MKRLIIMLMCYISFIGITASTNPSRNVKVGDTFTVHAANHSYTQSVAWNWDYGVLELQGSLNAYSTSATFKAIKETTLGGTTIQAITYYHQSGTTSTGINKDVDTWKVFISGSGSGSGSGGDDNNGGGSTSITEVKMSIDGTTAMLIDQTLEVFAVTDGYYDGDYKWTSSNQDVVELKNQKNSKIELYAKSAGTSYIRITLGHGFYHECLVTVVEADQHVTDGIFFYALNQDYKSIKILGKRSNDGRLEIPSHFCGKPITVIEDNAFNGYEITSVVIPGTVTVIGSGAFKNCSNLVNVFMDDSVEVIDDHSFSNCQKLSTIVLSNSLITIGENVFYHCYGLNEIILPNSLKNIGKGAFDGCNLKTVSLPDNVASIGLGAFNWCHSIEKIYYLTDNPIVFDRIFTGIFDICKSATLYVKESAIDKVRITVPWSEFKNIEVYNPQDSGIEDVIYNVRDARTSIYDMNGVKVGDSVEDLMPGIYIIRHGAKASKVIVR